jgi:hypothetical protein
MYMLQEVDCENTASGCESAGPGSLDDLEQGRQMNAAQSMWTTASAHRAMRASALCLRHANPVPKSPEYKTTKEVV